jgi:BMFP domain-containing protein YqiC
MSNATATIPNPATVVLDAWMSGYKALNWNQDQLEKLGTTWMSQAHTMRHDGEKVLEVMVGQAKSSADELQANAKSMLGSVPGWDVLTQADLRRQVAELSAKLDAKTEAKTK